MSLTYQDCQELKDAGFPQELNGDYVLVNGTKREGFYDKEFAGVYCPTLEELIEECGERFVDLINSTKYESDVKWQANGENTDTQFGSSPIQAVKNLYCALNKTK